MSWRESLRDASFRGVSFKWRETAAELGRRATIHEYALAEDAEPEDIGGKAKRGTIDAYVLGDNYFANRDQLLLALDQPGPGLLIHPTLGEMTIQVMDVRLSETTQEGGLARFQISYAQAKPQVTPSSRTDTAIDVAQKASDASDAADASFQGNYRATSTNLIAAAKTSVAQALGKVEGFIGAVQSTADDIEQMAAYPAKISAEIDSDILQIQSLASLKNLFGSIFSSSSHESQALANDQALTLLVQTQAVIAACLISAQTGYVSRDDAIANQTVLLDQIDVLSYQVDDETYATLMALRSSVVIDIQTRSADLARITTYTAPETTPALVLAQRLYGTDAVLAASEDIIARNHVQHPSFVPGGVELEVLSDWKVAA